MTNFRAVRMGEDIERELAAILREMKDPRLHDGLISIVRCDMTHDLSFCRVYISSMKGLDTAKTAAKALKKAQGFIRRELGTRLRLRYAPELAFEATDSIEYSANISRILNDMDLPPEEETEGGNDEGDIS